MGGTRTLSMLSECDLKVIFFITQRMIICKYIASFSKMAERGCCGTLRNTPLFYLFIYFIFFASLKKLKKHELIFCKPQKAQKNMNCIFCKTQKAQKKHELNFLQV